MNLDLIKKLREQTGAGIADCKKALAASLGDLAKAKVYLRENGIVEVYSHNGQVGVLVEVLCETDFVVQTADFKNLAHELALQIASMNPQSVEELLVQVYIRDNSLTVDQLIKSVIGKLGENIQIGRFERIALGG